MRILWKKWHCPRANNSKNKWSDDRLYTPLLSVYWYTRIISMNIYYKYTFLIYVHTTSKSTCTYTNLYVLHVGVLHIQTYYIHVYTSSICIQPHYLYTLLVYAYTPCTYKLAVLLWLHHVQLENYSNQWFTAHIKKIWAMLSDQSNNIKKTFSQRYPGQLGYSVPIPHILLHEGFLSIKEWDRNSRSLSAYLQLITIRGCSSSRSSIRGPSQSTHNLGCYTTDPSGMLSSIW